MTPQSLALAILGLFPRAHVAPMAPAAIVTAATAHRVPVALLASTCWHESALGANPRAGLLCGVWPGVVAVLQRRGDVLAGAARSYAVQADAAAMILARGLLRCRTWQGAATYHYAGRCAAPAGWRPRGGVVDPIRQGEHVAALARRIGGGR